MTYNLATITRPERVRNIVDPPMLPDELSRREDERRLRLNARIKAAYQKRKRARMVQMIY